VIVIFSKINKILIVELLNHKKDHCARNFAETVYVVFSVVISFQERKLKEMFKIKMTLNINKMNFKMIMKILKIIHLGLLKNKKKMRTSSHKISI